MADQGAMWSASSGCYVYIKELRIFTLLYTYTHIHTYVHTWHIHITLGDSRRHKHTYIPIHMHRLTYQYKHTCIQTCMHACTQTHRYLYKETHMQLAYIRMHVYTCIRILYQLMMREPLAIHFNWLTIKLVPNHKLKIWVCIFWKFDGLHIREN